MAKLKILPRALKFLYVLDNMWEIKFQERSSKNHVIHKVNVMVITKVKRLMLPNILQSEQELHIFGILVKPVLQYQFYEYWVTRS